MFMFMAKSYGFIFNSDWKFRVL